jgi:hypothetical protein
MTAFKKFDPQAFLERERLAADGSSTLAALATLAAQPAETKIANNEVGAAPIGPNEEDNDQIKTPTPAKVEKVAKVQPQLLASAYQSAFDILERKCPDFVPDDRWRQVVDDGQQFLIVWGEQAEAFGWSARELFGLHSPPERPVASYQRLARYDETGVIWLLQGRPVVALTETTAAIQHSSGNVTTCRKHNKPALGPLGDSLDDMGPVT